MWQMGFGKVGKRGFSIAFVMIASVVALLVVFALASSSLTQLNLTTHQDNAEQARNAAESAIHLAIAGLMEERTLGVPGSGSEMRVTVTRERAEGEVVFSADSGPGLSLNNLDSDTPVRRLHRMVPAETAHLVGVGRCNGVERKVEAVVSIPRFPAVISTSGDFSVTGALMVGVLPLGTDTRSAAPGDLLPGDIVSNSEATPAVVLNPLVTVYGDVISRGGVSVDRADIRGETRPNDSEQPLPRLRISDYNPLNRTDVTNATLLPQTLSGTQTLASWNHQPHDLRIQGDLHLEAGILYVGGNLTVTGAVKGKGAVIGRKSISIQGQTELEALDQVALLSEGDVSLAGGGKFRGVVYTEGNFSSDEVELFGAFIANGKDKPGKGKVHLNEVGMVVLDPSLSFHQQWLSREVTYGIPIFSPAPPSHSPVSTLESRFLEINDEGLAVLEFDILSDFPGADGAVPPPELKTRYREYYDSTGQLVRREGVMPDGRWRDYLPREGAPGTGLQFDEDSGYQNSNKSNIHFEAPTPHPPQRVLAYDEVANFELDFSRFLSLEERMRIELWIEH